MTTTHFMFDKRVQVFKRPDSRIWQCATRIGDNRYRASTGEEDLDAAKDVAEEWYLDLRGKRRSGELKAAPETKPKERTFRDATEAYIDEIKLLTIGTRSPKYVEFMELRMNRHILPYFGDKPLSAINKGLVQSYRAFRAKDTIERTYQPAKAATDKELAQPEKPGQPPARSTMLQEIVHIRQVLKFAEGNGWIPFVPNLSTPYLTQTKRGRRAWFSPGEYDRLYNETRLRIANEKDARWLPYRHDLHDFVLIMANTGLRPDEAKNLEFRDVSIEKDYATKATLLVIDVRGKVGVGYCKSTPNAVFPFERLKERRISELRAAQPELSDEDLHLKLLTTKVFLYVDQEYLRKILEHLGLRYDRDGQRRTAYSLRHTYICNRLMEGAGIHVVANNCRTSPQMIEQHYAAHIKDRIDAGLLNVSRPKHIRENEKKKGLAAEQTNRPPM